MNEVEADAAVDEDMPWIYPGAFDDAALEEKIQKSLEDAGVTIVRECKLIEIISDKDLSQSKNSMSKGDVGAHDSTASEEHASTWGGQLERIVLKRLDIPDEEEEEDEFEQDEKSHNSDEEGGAAAAGSGPAGGMEDSNLMENEDMSQAE